jgi:hypothetical protein
MAHGLMKLLYRHPRSAALIAVILIVQVLELLLLQVKYDIFTGGFLQPHSYFTAYDRFLFITFSAWMDLSVFGSFALIWYRLSERMRIRPILSAYHYFFASASVMVFWLAIKFKLLTYFSDTLNFVIVRNLGGGSISGALAYVTEETAIIAFMLLVVSGVYLAGLYLIMRSGRRGLPATDYSRRLPAWRLLLAGLVLTIVLIVIVNNNPELRYGVGKKTSFFLISLVLDPVTDLDRDGHGALVYPADQAPFNAAVYPGALDIPDNGIDEDMIGGDFTLSNGDGDPFELLIPRAGQHMLLIVLESARWDLIDKRRNGLLVAPNIMAIKDEGTLIPYAYTHTGYTTSTLKAIFNRTLSYNKDRMTLADYLHKSDYTLSFLSGQDESFGDVASSVGMKDEGVHFFDARTAIDDRVYPSTDSGSLRLSEARMVQAFQQQTKVLDWARPQFLYVNLQAAHFPYTHPTMPALVNDRPIPRSKIRAENHEWLEATYWNAIANADWAVGEMVKQLRSLGVYDDTLVIIVSDHGESLFDDGFLGHGHALNETQTRIPLVINRPGLVIRQAIGHLDLAELMVRLATGQYHSGDWQDSEQGVYMLVGSLGSPRLLGTVSYGERRTVLDMHTQSVYFSDQDRWVDLDAALQDPHLGSRVRDLVLQWETLRWSNHQAKSSAP